MSPLCVVDTVAQKLLQHCSRQQTIRCLSSSRQILVSHKTRSFAKLDLAPNCSLFWLTNPGVCFVIFQGEQQFLSVLFLPQMQMQCTNCKFSDTLFKDLLCCLFSNLEKKKHWLFNCLRSYCRFNGGHICAKVKFRNNRSHHSGTTSNNNTCTTTFWTRLDPFSVRWLPIQSTRREEQRKMSSFWF